MADKKEWIVGGFQFGTENDAKIAKAERGRIEHLEGKLDYDNPQMLEAVYKKAVNNRVFQTPVGYAFLKRLQDSLRENGSIEDIPNIPVYGVYSLREGAAPTVERIKVSQKKPKVKPTKETISIWVSLTFNVVLLLLVVGMYVIVITGSKNPNVLNYEKVIQNRYSQWEKDLSDRERVIREKEKELLINE